MGEATIPSEWYGGGAVPPMIAFSGKWVTVGGTAPSLYQVIFLSAHKFPPFPPLAPLG